MVLDRLSEDHRNFRQVLNLLERQVDRLHSDESPDFYLMLKILEYFQEYPSRCHHPAEELLFSIYVQRSSGANDVIQALRWEHEDLEMLTSQLKGAVEAIILDDIVERPLFEEQLDNFLRRQRAHIVLEDTAVFPQIHRVLEAGDWEKIDARLCREDDPVFGPRIQKEYQELCEQIFDQGLEKGSWEVKAQAVNDKNGACYESGN